MGTRNYDNTLGRFTETDPSGKDADYLYTDNDPINFVDLDGLRKKRSKIAACVANEILNPFKDADFGATTLVGAGAEIAGTGASAFAFGAAGIAAGLPLAITGLAIAGIGAAYAYKQCD